MKLFSEKVKFTSTNSSLNVIQVENFEEIFFGVYEIEINKSKYLTEKVFTYKGNPVVSVPVIVENEEIFYPFILMKGKPDVLFNENNTMDNFEEIDIPNVESEELYSDPQLEKVKLQDIEDNRKKILEEIARAKSNARKEILKVKEERLKTLREESTKKEKLLRKTLDDARCNMVEEFVKISQKIKDELIDVNDNRFGEIQETIDNKIQDLCISLGESLTSNIEDSEKYFDSKIRELVKEAYTALTPKIDKELENIAIDIVKKVDNIEKTLGKKLEHKADSKLIENLNHEMVSIKNINIELNDKINRGVNKALSRVGNVTSKIDDLTIAISEEVENKIFKAEENITKYYESKLEMLEKKNFEITEETRRYIIELVRESKDNLITEIRQIKNEKPIEYIIESKNKKEVKNFDTFQKEFDNKITSKIDAEVTRLRRYISVYSGGGSVAVQFANGGTMNGNLIVNGTILVNTISASQYLGIPYPTESDTLDIVTSRGNTTNNSISVGGISATNYTGITKAMVGLSAVDNTSDQNKPISISTQNALNLKLDSAVFGGLSSNWNNSYNTVNNLSSNWNNSYNTVNNLSSNWNNAYTSLSSKANLSGGNVFTGGNQTIIGNLSTGGNLNITGNVAIVGSLSATGNIITTGSLSSTNIVSASRYQMNLIDMLTTTGSDIKLSDQAGNTAFRSVRSGGTQFFQIGNTNDSIYFTALNGSSASVMKFNSQVTQFVAGDRVTTPSPTGIFEISNVAKNAVFNVLESGNVGLGTVTPNQKLTISGNISASGSTYTNGLTSIGLVTATNQSPISSIQPNDVLTLALLRQINGLSYNVINFPTTAGWSSTSTGTGSGITHGTVALSLQAGTAAVSGTCVAYVSTGGAGRWTIGSFGGSGYGGIDFSKEIEINFHIGTQFAYMPGLESWAVILGDLTATNPISAMLPTSGTDYVAVACLSGGLITLQGLKNGGTQQISPTLSIHNAGVNSTSYRLIINGGTAYLYSGLTFLGSISSMPTGQVATNSNKFYVMHDCYGVTGQAIVPTVNFSNMSIRWY